MALEDTKFVKSVEAKLGGKSGTYWTITWEDGKHDNLFNKTMMDKCEEAQAKKLAIHYIKKKREGSQYFNIVSLDLVRDKLPPPTEAKMLPGHEEVIKKAKDKIKPKEEKPLDNKVRSMTLSYAKDICVASLFPLGNLGTLAFQLERYCLSELTATQLDANLNALLSRQMGKRTQPLPLE